MIRVKSAFNVMKSNFVGDARKCKMGQDAKDIEKYCVNNFESFDEIESCKVTFIILGP